MGPILLLEYVLPQYALLVTLEVISDHRRPRCQLRTVEMLGGFISLLSLRSGQDPFLEARDPEPTEEQKETHQPQVDPDD